MWYQKTLTLSAKSRGFHLVTDEILNQGDADDFLDSQEIKHVY